MKLNLEPNIIDSGNYLENPSFKKRGKNHKRSSTLFNTPRRGPTGSYLSKWKIPGMQIVYPIKLSLEVRDTCFTPCS
jgi:hypothetical protein